MATKKTGTQTRSRSGSGAKKGGRQTAAQRHAQQQMHAIILFAAGILVAALTFITGASVWKWLHDFLFGVFGMGSALVAAMLIYIAVLLTMDKPYKSRLILCSLLILSFCTSLQIFQMGLPEEAHFLDQVIAAVLAGIEGKSGGLVGALPGLPMLLSFNKLGAGIIIVLLMFVLLMLLTGGTLIGLARAVRKPVETISEAYTERVVSRPAPAPRAPKEPKASKQPRKQTMIDIPLDGEEPPKMKKAAEPKTAKPEAAPPKAEEEKKDPLPEEPKFSIDIPLDDQFDPAESGGFSLLSSDDPLQYVPPAEPTIEDLVNKAATDNGRFHFQGEAQPSGPENAAAAVPPVLEENNPLHLNLPPDIDAVDPPSENDETVPFVPKSQVEEEGTFSPPTAPRIPVYHKPPFSLLRETRRKNESDITEEMKANAQRLVDTLSSFGVQTRIVDISRGPAVTRYELQPSAGVKISKITGLADDIALNLASAGVRIEAPIPNKAAVGIEVPNKVISAVTLREIVDSEEFSGAKSKLAVALGRDIAGQITLADIAKMPHLLIAGSTGSGKSVCINSIIMSLLFQSTPEEVRFLMIDPKVVELGVYNGIPQLLVPVVTDPKKAAGALSWAVTEMLKRYKLFADNSVRDLHSYNALCTREGHEGMEKLPQVVIIIDELADLMMAAPNEIEDYICRLAQMARAAGMHLIIATQRPSVDVITGVIKANIPSRIAFAVSSQIDSRTILDMGGAEKLLGRGDMLFSPVGSPKPIRVQGCFVTDEEIEAVISYIKSDSQVDYDESIVSEIDNHVVASGKGKSAGASAAEGDGGSEEDEMLMPAIECVVEAGMASTSLLQRRLKLGYARAARIVDEMEQRGIVGPYEGSKPRQVLISPERLAEMKLSQ